MRRQTTYLGMSITHLAVLALLMLLDCSLLTAMGAVVYRQWVDYQQALLFLPSPPPVDLAPPTLTPAELQYAEGVAALVKEQSPAVQEIREGLQSLQATPELVFDTEWQDRTRASLEVIHAADAGFRDLEAPPRYVECSAALLLAATYYDLAGDVVTCGADWGDVARIGRSGALLDLAEEQQSQALQCVKTVQR